MFSDLLRNAIRRDERTLTAIAEECEVPQPTLSRFLNGQDLRLATAERLAKYYSIDFSTIAAERNRPASKGGNNSAGSQTPVPLPAARIARLLKIVTLMQTTLGGCRAEWLADQVGVSRRTIFRDLETLRLAQVPLTFDDSTGKHRVGNYCLPDVQDVVWLVAACELSLLSTSPEVRDAVERFTSQLPAQCREEIDSLLAGCEFEPLETDLEDQPLESVQALMKAVRQRMCVQVEYVDGDETIQTKLSPYRLVVFTDGWSVIGRSSRHRSVQTIPVSDIDQIETTDQHFTMPRKYQRKK